KRVVAVDDSIVRGNTTRQIVAMLFEAGAAEVHVRVSSPPIISQCYYGMDFADEDELIAAKRTVEEVREYLGATSLAYLSLEGLQASTRRPESSFCRACLTRDYPTAVPRGGPPMPGLCIPPCSEGVVDISRLLSAAVSGDLDHKEVQRGSESSCPSLAIPRSHGGNQVSPMYPPSSPSTPDQLLSG